MVNTATDRDERLRRPAGLRSVRLGDTKVSFVPDGAIQGRPSAWLPDTTDEFWAAHPEYLDASGYLVASLGGLLVENGDRALLIDAGFGPHALPADPATPNGTMRGGALLDNLAELGRGPEQLEAVAFSHLHPDHLGWAAHSAPGGDRPVFAHADYLVAEPEWAQHALPEAAGLPEEAVAALAPRVRTVADGQEIFPGVRVRITAGHTAGHAEFVITGGGTRLIAFGDSMHSPVQADHPEWSCVYDHDPARSADHRRRLVAELEEPDTIGFGIHFADVVFGQVRRDGHGPAWRPLDTRDAGDDR
ncbi:MBL fold metallo-hydrolase [Streptomyces griseomycini]|uniref:Glyoxylase-like metal-dependent hydrolase (Beta-lactamase superfamily II) n=1 Tax=Streptomyces griseomycini TaxID=66895 RepID=A0A7W7VAD8_9ACTN|nr:MBL fold metallo-hydrolase [Streptomyces griseomycini]MBB4902834.1 glyoxylase-like metal-dependent hydrolase (beta-lactamase superfamily II) [Streptomyces griseomycini]GGQ34621.1 MBL fold hydrolase [Streptomyces griseomycini]GGR51615.1 MBL fold hydrolase [Streptomyces griseomycini]